MKTLWIIGGGIEAVPGIELAKKMGLNVIVSDGNPNAPGFNIADVHYVVSTYDVEATVAIAKKHHYSIRNLDGVMCIASDIPHTVASVAKELNLLGIPVNIAFMMIDKLAMKNYFKGYSIPLPWYQQINSSLELKKIVQQEGFNFIVKPVDSRGARGVLRLTEDVDLDWAFDFSQSFSPTKRVMVEQYLDGPQLSTESLVVAGKAYTCGFSDRNYELLEVYKPHIIENGGDIPSFIPKKQQQKVHALIQKVVDSLSLENGVIKGDIVIYKNMPYVIEVAPRLSGGYFCSHEIPLNTGVDFLGNAIRIALGEKIEIKNLEPRYNHCVCQRFLFVEEGRVVTVFGAEEVAKRSGIELCEVRVQVGDIIKPMTNHTARAGVVITTGKNREEAQERAVNAIRDIHIEIEPIESN